MTSEWSRCIFNTESSTFVHSTFLMMPHGCVVKYWLIIINKHINKHNETSRYFINSCKRSVAPRVTVLLTPRILVIMFVILSRKESFKKKVVCYSIKQRSKLLLLHKEAKTTMQWSHVKTFKFVFYCFYCLTSIFFVLFCFVR